MYGISGEGYLGDRVSRDRVSRGGYTLTSPLSKPQKRTVWNAFL